MIRFIHTADWQLGLRPRGAQTVAAALRQARLETVSAIGRLAAARTVDFVIVAGDVFEDNQVGAAVVHETLARLEQYPCPVYLLPGNHDPLTPGSVYLRPAFQQAPTNVRVLREPVPVPLAGAVLLPSPTVHKQSAVDPTRLLADQPTEPGRCRLGVAHGSLRIEGKYQPDDAPIALDAAARARLDYLALGHWHRWYRHDARLGYPGTPEPTAFEETESGQVAVVTIAEAGAEPQVEAVSVGQLTWYQRDLDLTLSPAEVLARCRAEITALPAPKQTLWRLRLSGRLGVTDSGVLTDLENWASARVLYVDVRREGLRSGLDRQELAARAAVSALLSGLLDDLGVLERLADPQTPGALPPEARPLPTDYLRDRLAEVGSDPRVVAEAGLLLGELWGENRG